LDRWDREGLERKRADIPAPLAADAAVGISDAPRKRKPGENSSVVYFA
jgi:hypothetical protein